MRQGISTHKNVASSYDHLSFDTTELEPSTMLKGGQISLQEPQNGANYFPKIGAAFPTVSSPVLGGFPQSSQSLTLGGSADCQSPAGAPVLLGKGKLAQTSPLKDPPRSRSRKRKGPDKRCKKTSLALTREQHLAIHAGWEHARLIGLPLNWMLTIRPADIDALTIEERHKFWERTYKKLDQYCRARGFSFTAAWSRESNRNGSDAQGEHWHILLYLPTGSEEHFRKTVTGKSWFPGRHEIDLSPRHQFSRWENSKRYNAASYLCKAANPRLVRADPSIPYRSSGPIFGRRAGVTRNLGPKAIEAYQAYRRHQNGSVLPDASRSKLAA